MNKHLLAALLAATLLLALSAEAGEPRPMNLVSSPGGFPNVLTKYVMCGTPAASGADYCLPEGTWTGLCSPEKDRTQLKRFEGPLTLVEGTPRVPGCDERIQLLWHGTGKPEASYVAPAKVTLSGGAKGQQRASFEYAGQPYTVALSPQTWRLELSVGESKEGKSARTLDLSTHFQELQVPRSAEVTLSVEGDVTGDGAPELIITHERSGFTRRYEAVTHIPIAVMVTLSGPPSVVGRSHGSPWSLYTLKDCKSAGLACDVMSHLEKQASCEHFAGEEPYDKERAAFLRKSLEGCDKLPAQRQSLQRKYKSDTLIQQILGKQQQ